jgi:hypothetical protein
MALACSGSSKKDAEDPDKWDMGDTEPSPKSDPDPVSLDDDDDDDDESGDDDDDAAPKGKPVTQEDDYEINERDCDALARAYGGAWKRDEFKKLNKKKLSKEKFDAQAAQLEEHATGMADNWRSECYKTVGTAYLRSRLQCALKAKSMKRFNDCMDGLADQ